MKLISLTSNKDSFNDVKFNPNGISLIVAKHSASVSTSNKSTYNGLGKSLLVHIIHFCLGGKSKNFESFTKKLPSWQFILKFKIENTTFVASRNTDNIDKIILHYDNKEEELSINVFTSTLEKLLFNIPEDIKFLTFRSLLPFFIRPKKESYVTYDSPSKVGSEYQKELYNSFLLGLNTTLIQEKYILRKEQDRIDKLTINIQKDELLKDFFSKEKDVSLRLIDIEDDICKLQDNIDNYEVASDYYDVKIEADKIERTLSQKYNETLLLNNQIKSIDKSLKISPDLEKENIEKVYNKQKYIFQIF
ncbi:MAG TPA: hypothetical protein EYG85_02510 [Crocinitomix sp.]|nr:hypothetical protein [Crocinitomix sp.]